MGDTKPATNQPYTSVYKEPTNIGEMLFPSSLDTRQIVSVGKGRGKTTTQVGPPVNSPPNPAYADYMQQALKLLNPNLYGR